MTSENEKAASWVGPSAGFGTELSLAAQEAAKVELSALVDAALLADLDEAVLELDRAARSVLACLRTEACSPSTEAAVSFLESTVEGFSRFRSTLESGKGLFGVGTDRDRGRRRR